MGDIRNDANLIIKTVINENLPQLSVKNVLNFKDFTKDIYVVAIGKAAWTMANATSTYFGDKIKDGIVITKYDHSQGDIKGLKIYEAGHPTPDENTVLATKKVIEMVQNLGKEDEVIFLVSGGGSALFEAPKQGITLNDIVEITNILLSSGASIVEINTIRKRLSQVKAGSFAKICEPAKVTSIVLSDVLGDRLDTIASGPAYADSTTAKEAEQIIEKYSLNLPHIAIKYIKEETPKSITNVTTHVTGSVRSLCNSAKAIAESLGYNPYILTTTLSCEAKEAGRFLANIAYDTKRGETHFKTPCAIIAGGETVVKIIGNGKGGRNQELALSAAVGISELDNVLIFSLGSDGTDGPTNAAGGIVNGNTVKNLKLKNIDIHKYLQNNDSYHALQALNDLIIIGPTGTNVNDVCVLLIR